MGSISEEDEKRFRMTPTQQMLSTCTGALATSLLVTPLDVVKIRLQSQQKAMQSNKCFIYCNGLMDHLCHCVNGKVNVWVKRPSHFNSTMDAFVQIVRKEGMFSLWSGLPPTLVMAVPSTIIYFVTYEQLRVTIKDKYVSTTGIHEQPVWIPLMSGGLARVWAVTLISPLELIRTKMQSKVLSYRDLFKACSELYKVKGLGGFWMGWSPTIMRDVPFSAIYWTGYETIKKYFGHSEDPSLGLSFFAGAAAGTIAGTLTLPFDVVKTHKQIELGELDLGTKGKMMSTNQALKKIYNNSGISGLFTGLIPRIVKVAPACAIMISSYEIGKAFFTKYNRERLKI